MARLALSIGLGILGAALAPLTAGTSLAFSASFGFAMGSALGGIIGAVAFPGKGQHVYGARVNDMQVSGSSYGTFLPMLFGSMRLGGQIFWSTGLKETTTTTKQSAKGGPSVSNTTYTYSVSFAAAFCEGPATITRVWGDSKLIYDVTGTGQLVKNLNNIPTLYTGSTSQTASPLMVSHDGANNVPGYRGTCYGTWEDFPLTNFGNRLPNIRAEVTANATAAKPVADIPFPQIALGGAWEDGFGIFASPNNGNTIFVVSYNGSYIQRIDLTTNTQVAAGVPSLGPILVGGLGWVSGFTPTGPIIPAEFAMATDNNNDIWVAMSGFTGYPTGTGGNAIVCFDGYTFKAKKICWMGAVGTSPAGNTGAAGVPITMTPYVTSTDTYLVCHHNNWTSNTEKMIQVVRCSDATIVGRSFFQPQKFAGDVSVVTHVDQAMAVVNNDKGISYNMMSASHTNGGGAYTTYDWYINWTNMPGGASNFVAWGPGYTSTGQFAFTGNSTVGVGSGMVYNPTDSTLIVYTTTGYLIRVDANPASSTYGQILETSGAALFYTASGGIFSWKAAGGGSDNSSILPAFLREGICRDGVLFGPKDNTGVLRAVHASDFTVINDYTPNTWESGVDANSQATFPPCAFIHQDSMSVIFADVQNGTVGGHPIYKTVRIFLERIATTGVTADTVVNAVCQRAGINLADVDTSKISNLSVIGMPITSLMAGKDIIANLMQVLFFEGRETNFKLEFLPRGQVPVEVIAENDLGLVNDKSKLVESLMAEQDVPKEVEVIHIDPAQDYQQNKQHKVRHHRTKKTLNKTSISFPVVMTNETAAQLADKILWTAETERRTYTMNLWKAYHILLDPCDVIQFNYDGSIITGRITQATAGQNLATALDVTAEDSQNYASAQNGNTTPGFVPQILVGAAKTGLWLLDIPYLQDPDADSVGNTGFYAAMVPSTGGTWTAGVLYQSSDNLTFNQIDASSSGIAYGVTTTALGAPAHSAYSWDEVNTLTLQMVYGANPTSDSFLNVLNGTNAAILYPSLEIIQFRNVTVNGDGTVTLSGLLRGRRGTEWATSGHSIGETVLFPLEQGGLLHEQVSLSQFGATRYYKPITAGQDLNTGSEQPLTLQSRDLMPYAPSHFVATRNGGTGDITMTWLRRTRLQGAWVNGSGTPGTYSGPQTGDPVPVSEDSEAYSVDILNGGGTVVRTINGLTSPTVVYTAAQQTTDFGGTQTALHARVYQLSAQVGRGFVADNPNVLAGLPA